MNGVIGFFDILGYKSFLKHNTELEIAREVISIINKVPAEALTKLTENSKDLEPFSDLSKHIKHFIFSDTVIFLLEFNTEYKYPQRLYMTILAGLLSAEMFSRGLPLRGVIHEGEYIYENNCFAGKAILEPIEICAKLNYSGIVCTEELSNKIEILRKKLKPDSFRHLFDHLTPMKDGEEISMMNIDWLGFVESTEYKNDVENFIKKSFCSHQKDCSGVEEKINNTAKIIIKMINRHSGTS